MSEMHLCCTFGFNLGDSKDLQTLYVLLDVGQSDIQGSFAAGGAGGGAETAWSHQTVGLRRMSRMTDRLR